jgi:hypothetical protein
MYTESQKKATYKWRETNKEDYMDYHNNYRREVWYVNNAEKIKTKRMETYYLKREFQIFRNILL